LVSSIDAAEMWLAANYQGRSVDGADLDPGTLGLAIP
jgi:hypothetical protein